MTAEKLIEGLRERGHRVHRSREPGAFVLIARMKPDDPLLEWLARMGAGTRRYYDDESQFHVAAGTPNDYEVSLLACKVDLDREQGEQEGEFLQRRRLVVWEAAAPTKEASVIPSPSPQES